MRELDIKEYFSNTKNKLKVIFNKFGRIILSVSIVAIFLLLIYLYNDLTQDRQLRVHFFDIGQGDSILIETKNKKNILIDAGPDDKVIRKLEKNISINDDIDMAIMTHPDSDHVAGFIYVLDKYNVKNILTNGDTDKYSEVYKELKNKIDKQNKDINSKLITANCGDEISIEGDNDLHLYVLHPMQGSLVINDSNDNSIVVLLVYGKYSFLFTGDAGKDVEKKLFFNIDMCFASTTANTIKNNLKNLTVLKASHHGSSTGSSEEFIKKLKPEYVVISAGKNNRYGHPSLDTLQILNKYSKNILNTINDGDITFETDGNEFNVLKSK